MDTFSISTILVIVAIILLIILWQWVSKKKKTGKSCKILNSVAKSYNCKIATYDFTNNILIGTDEDSRYLFYYNKKDKTSLALQLNEIERCRINLVRHGIGSGNNIQTVIDSIQLVITLCDTKKSEVTLDCYNSIRDFYFPDKDLALIEKWDAFIKAGIKKISAEKSIKS